jgi:hypothetical protein
MALQVGSIPMLYRHRAVASAPNAAAGATPKTTWAAMTRLVVIAALCPARS